MRKFFVGLLSIFMLVGATILSACGQSTPELHVYYNEAEVSQTIPIQLDSADPDSGYILLSAEITGADDGKVTASAVGGYESVISVEPAGTNGNKQFFKVNGLSETENGPAAVVFRGTPGDLTKYVYVDVFSYVSAMQQNSDETKNQFLVDGQTYTIGENGLVAESNSISEDQLIKFTPSQKSRRSLTWEIKKADGSFEKVTSFKVDAKRESNDYVYEEGGKNYITLKVTDKLGAQGAEAILKLEVLDPVQKTIELGWNYDAGTPTFETGTDDEGNVVGSSANPYKLIANIGEDKQYIGYAWVGYAGTELEISPVVAKKMVVGGKVEYVPLASTEAEKAAEQDEALWLENNVTVLKVSASSEYTIYSVKTAKADNIGDYEIGFKIGYAGYNYFGTTANFYIDIAEKVNQVLVTTKDLFEISGGTSKDGEPDGEVTLYESYADVTGVSREKEGQMFKIDLSPNVLDGSNQYTLTLDATTTVNGAITEDGSCPIEVFYRSPNGKIDRLELQEDDGLWHVGALSGDDIVKQKISANGEIHIKAVKGKLRNQTTRDLSLIFTSVDNQDATTELALTLKKSASQSNFADIQEVVLEKDEFTGRYKIKVDETTGETVYVDAGSTGRVVIDSSKATTVTKAFKLGGQSNLDGLDIAYNSENITVSNWQELESSSEVNKEYVIFAVDFTLKPSAYGKTLTQSYSIVHENGSSVTGAEDDKKFKVEIILPFEDVTVFPDMGNNLSNSITDAVYYAGEDNIKYLMLKNNTLTPILFKMTSFNGYTPKISDLTIKYLNINDFAGTTEQFLALGDYKQDVVDLATTMQDYDTVVKFTSDDYSVGGAISTSSVGYTYILLSFSGKDVNGDDIVVHKVVLVESYNAPEGMTVNPEADRKVEVYAVDSVSDEDESLTYKNVQIDFDNKNTTYNTVSNVQIKSRYYNDNNPYYQIESLQVSSAGITFKITGLTTEGEHERNDEIIVEYSIKKGAAADEYVVYKFETSIAVTIKKAQRVESVVWRNADENGLYYEIGSTERDAKARYLILEAAPKTARNQAMQVVVTDKVGNEDNTIVAVNDKIAEKTVAINLKDAVSSGKSGYAYILPADAVFKGNLKYYYCTVNGTTERIEFSQIDFKTANEQSASIDVKRIGAYYDDLITYGYFKSNSEDGVEYVPFANVVLKIAIEVADGSAEHPFRIFNSNQLQAFNPALHYVVMNDITVEDWETVALLSGGIKGYTGKETITFKGDNNKTFVDTIDTDGYVKDLTFVGNVDGNAFVASTNNGTIENVTIDTNGNKSSVLSVATGNNAGAIAAHNKGTISGVGVYGATITAGNYVGGVVGENDGSITNARVEFYNLATDSGFATNIFSGSYVGGIAGKNNGSIYQAYAYDYTLSKNQKNVAVKGTAVSDPLVAIATATSEIDYVFAVVGLDNTQCAVQGISSYYLGYYAADGEYKLYPVAPTGNQNLYMLESDTNFDGEINNNKRYFKDFHQPKPITKADIENLKVETYKDVNGYYKSIEVNAERGLLFYYQLNADLADLTTTELNDITKLNTIAVADLLGFTKSSEGIVVTTSNAQILRVNGSSLEICSTGDVTITISSKQDASVSETIAITIVDAITDLVISRIDENGREMFVEESKALNINKTKSVDLTVYQRTTDVILGNFAQRYSLKGNSYKLKATSAAIIDTFKDANGNGQFDDGERFTDTNANNQYDQPDPAHKDKVTAQVSGNIVKVETTENSVNSTMSVMPILFAEPTTKFEGESDEEFAARKALAATFQQAIEKVFTRSFAVNPTEGVISLEISEEQIPLSPASTAQITVKIETTAQGDVVFPEIKFDGKSMIRALVEGTENEYVYSNIYGEKVLTVVRTVLEKDETSKPYIYRYNLAFSVYPDYRNRVAEDMEFDVYFKSASGHSSLADGGTFKLLLSRQNFTNIDVTNLKITGMSIRYTDEIYKTGMQTSTLAPGNASILKVNVNPEYAYYDYAEISYSGASVANAVNIEAVRLVNRAAGEYGTLIKSVGTTEKIGTRLRFIPADNSTTKYNLYFKLWINTTVDKDTTLVFTVAFYKNGEKEALDYVRYFIKVSYLAEPKVTIDGQEIAYIAKGSTSEVKIEVLEDQRLETLILAGDGIQGVYLADPGEPELDPERGVNVYTTTLTANVKASTAVRNRFYIQASISREINGLRETKTAIATAVIVDFTIGEIGIENAAEGNFAAWQNISRTFAVQYNLLPEEYKAISDYEDEIADLISKKQYFAINGHYPQEIKTDDESQAEYYINYTYDKSEGKWVQHDLYDRLYVETAQGAKHVSDNSLDLPFKFTRVGKNVTVKGLKTNTAPVQMVLYTYIYAGGIQNVIETRFTISVTAFSDPDLPIAIKDADDFLALDPTGKTSIEAHDYILENDIVLENYTPFSTNAIRSLDGNGYTIYIKSFDVDSSDTLNLALFDTVGAVDATASAPESETVIKNVRVNYYNGGQITIDVSRHKEINIAGIAINNEGVITNCEVVSFRSGVMAGQSLQDDAGSPTLQHSATKGFNVLYRNGANSTQDVFIADNSTWTSQIAGFVINNTGSITNSRVGGDSVLLLGEEDPLADDGIANGIARATELTVDKFTINGQGDIAGFVLNNGGSIASSYVKNLAITNNSAATKYFTAGFVGKNNSAGSVLTSYVEGVESVNIDDNNKPYRFANTGSSLRSEMGYIAGFTYQNQGEIKDSYSNIAIANSAEITKVYLASGFVYENEGSLENCYSASQVANANYSQMNFSGVDKDGQLLKIGEYLNCYFFSVEFFAEEDQQISDTSTESQYITGALLIKNPSLGSSFYGFAVAENSSTEAHRDGVWRVDEYNGIKLIEADYISHSHRYKSYVANSTGPSISEEYEDEFGNIVSRSYVLPYATIDVAGRPAIDTSLGSDDNPIIIMDAQDWQDISGGSQSTYINAHVNGGRISGVYRIVKDIDLSGLSADILSTNKDFVGALYGNGFEIKGISVSQTNEEATAEGTTNLGLFASVSKVKTILGGTSPALVSNVDLNIVQVTAGNVSAVGGLAGIAKDATMVNIEVAFEDDAIIEGLHYVGGLVGFAYGDNKVKNISILNPNVVADVRTEDENGLHYIQASEIASFRNGVLNSVQTQITTNSESYSYAGAVAGYIDNFADNQKTETKFSYQAAEKTVYDVNNIRVQGIINVKGQVVGGLFGLTGYNTEINDAGLILEKDLEKSSRLASTRYFAGGIVGQSFGRLSRVFATHEESLQDTIENNMGTYYGGNTAVERGILDLFDTTKTDSKNSQVAIGGLVGYVGAGVLEISYSKLNVTAMSAMYSGGLIGYIDVDDSNEPFEFDSDVLYGEGSKTTESVKYIIQEVYTTGDVRANTMAGGLIGAIKGEGSQVGLLAVNAVNFITLHNYETETEDSLNEGQYDLSSMLKLNSFVGQFLTGSGTEQEFTTRVTGIGGETGVKLKGTNVRLYDSYIRFLNAKETYLNGGFSDSSERVPSVGRYNYYKFGEQIVYLTRFGENFLTKKLPEQDANGYDVYTIDSEEEKKLDFKEGVNDVFNIMEIGCAADFTSAADGRAITQAAFINSGIWSFANWYHPMADLFPSIKLQEIFNVAYLDVWNAADIFQRMNESDMLVIVRGLKTKESDATKIENYALDGIEIYRLGTTDEFFVQLYDSTGSPLDLIDCVNTPGNRFSSIERYAGRIVGGQYPQGTAQKTRIVSYAGNFITSVSEGFAVSDQTFVYNKIISCDAVGQQTTNEKITTTGGLFVDGTIAGATLTNLRIEIGAPVVISASETSGSDYGLIAKKIDKTSIEGLSIIDARAKDDTSYLVSVKAKNGYIQDINVGVIAGVLNQSDTENIMKVTNLAIIKNENDTFPLITVMTVDGDGTTVEGSLEYVNVGGFFGNISKQRDASTASTEVVQELSIQLSLTSKPTIIAVTPNITKRLTIGGFAAVVTGVDSIFIAENVVLDAVMTHVIPAKTNDLRIGNIIGHLQSNSHVVLDGNGATIRSIIKTAEEKYPAAQVNWAYIGGVVGYQGSMLSLTNFSHVSINETINKATGEYEQYKAGEILLRQPILNTTIEDTNFVYATGDSDFDKAERYGADKTKEIIFGGLVGISRAQLRIETPNMKISGYIDMQCSYSVRVGSILGATTAHVGESAGRSLYIAGAISSTLNANFSGTSNSIFFGGIVGLVFTKDENTHMNAQIGTSNNLIEYVGTVSYAGEGALSAAALGGILGGYSDHGMAEDSIEIYNTSFGGKIDINSGSCAKVAGTIARVAGDTIKETGTKTLGTSSITLQKGYHYGNVYVNYNKDKGFTSFGVNTDGTVAYCYGGIIGEVGAAKYNISSNYIAMTSHNSRYLASNGTAHALYGTDTPADANGSVPGNGGSSGVSKYNNFYSHAVCLMNDDNGTDIGYRSAYTPDRVGYNRTIIAQDELGTAKSGNIITEILKGIGSRSLDEGHKLNPRNFAGYTAIESKNLGDTDNDTVTTEDNFWGLTYYTITENQEIESQTFALTNTAFIGDGFRITYKNGTINTSTSGEANVFALFNNATGHSFISSLVEDVEVYIASALATNAEAKYAGLIHTADSLTQIFAVNVKGEMNIGNSVASATSIAGLGYMIYGKVADSSTDVDITERGKNGSYVYGFARINAKDSLTPIVENSFSMGQATTLSGSIICLFCCETNTLDGKTKNQYTIENCYTAMKADWRDYLTLSDTIDFAKDAGTAYYNSRVHNNANYYCEDSLGLTVGSSGDIASLGGTSFSYRNKSNFMPNSDADGEDLVGENKEWGANGLPTWISHVSFNYFYPRLKYGYLSMSSYMKQIGGTCDMGHDISEGGHSECYDCNVITYDYTRFANGINATSEDNSFYMITNPGALRYRIKLTNDSITYGEYVLKYDIDDSKSSTKFNEGSAYSGDSRFLHTAAFKGKFDGQGHTITGLTQSLFERIGSYGEGAGSDTTKTECYVRNLRLANVNITTIEGDKSNAKTWKGGTKIARGALADFAMDCTISNITIGGNITITTAENPYSDSNDNDYGVAIGGLVGWASGTRIDTVTSTIIFDITDETTTANGYWSDVAAIVGNADATTVKYCSNYGNITLNKEVTTTGKNTATAAGIAGYLSGDSSVTYSHNAGAILNSYIDSPAYKDDAAKSKTHYKAAGIVGATNGTTGIYNCYNTGIVKAGNKFANQNYDSLNRAGGIVAQDDGGDSTSITNCYNEGTVEALAANAIFEFKLYGTCSEGTSAHANEHTKGNHCVKFEGTRVAVIQKTPQNNCIAYGIGPGAGDTNVYKIEQDETGRTSVFANGASMPGDNVEVFSVPYNIDKWTRATNYNNLYYDSIWAKQNKMHYLALQVRYYRNADSIAFDDTLQTDYGSKNFLNLPTSFVYTMDYRLVTMMYADRGEKDSQNVVRNKILSLYYEGDSSGGNGGYGTQGTIKERFIMPINMDSSYDSEKNIFAAYIEKSIPLTEKAVRAINRKDGIVDAEKDKPITKKVTQAIDNKSKLFSQATNTSKVIQVGDTFFYIAANNDLASFQAGLASESKTITISDKYEYASYSIESVKTENGDDLSYGNTVWKINDDGSRSVTFKVYYDSTLHAGKKLEVAIKANYNKIETIDASALQFYIVGDKIGLGVTSLDYTNASNWETDVITKNGEEFEAVKATDSSGKIIYLVQNSDNGVNDLMYIQSATLKSDSTLVNTQTITQLYSKTWNIKEENPSSTNMLFTIGGTSSVSSARPAQQTIWTSTTYSLSADKILPDNLTGNVIAIDAAKNVVAASDDGGQTWYGADQKQLLSGISGATEIIRVVSEERTEMQESILSEYTADESGIITESISIDKSHSIKIYNSDDSEYTGATITYTEDAEDEDKHKVSISGLQAGSAYKVYQEYEVVIPEVVETVATINGHNVVSWSDSYSDSNSNKLRMLNGSGTVLAERVSGSWSAAVSFEDCYTSTSADSYLVEKAVEFSDTAVKNHSLAIGADSYDLSLTYKATTTEESKTYTGSSKTITVPYRTILKYEKISAYSLTKNTSGNGCSFLGVVGLDIAGTSVLDKQYFATTATSASVDISVSATSTISLTIYQTHKFGSNEKYNSYDIGFDDDPSDSSQTVYYYNASENEYSKIYQGKVGIDGAGRDVMGDVEETISSLNVVTQDSGNKYVYLNNIKYSIINDEAIISVNSSPTIRSFALGGGLKKSINGLATKISEERWTVSVIDLASTYYSWDEEKDELSIYAKKSDTEKASFSATNVIVNNSLTLKSDVDDTPRYNLILDHDISLGCVEGPYALNVNIIGNGYNMLYYGKSLYNSIDTGKSMKNVNILASVEAITNQDSYIFNTAIKGKMSQVNMYGVVHISLLKDAYVGNVLMNASAATKSTMTNINSYVSVDASYYLSNLSLSGKRIDVDTALFVDYGKHVAANGVDRYIVNKTEYKLQYNLSANVADNTQYQIFYTSSDVHSEGTAGHWLAYRNYDIASKDFNEKLDKYDLSIYLPSRLPFNYCKQSMKSNYTQGKSVLAGIEAFYNVEWKDENTIKGAWTYFLDYSREEFTSYVPSSRIINLQAEDDIGVVYNGDSGFASASSNLIYNYGDNGANKTSNPSSISNHGYSGSSGNATNLFIKKMEGTYPKQIALYGYDSSGWTIGGYVDIFNMDFVSHAFAR